jgi:hypothetical protein
MCIAQDEVRATAARRYDHIWFVEDDIFFTGNLATFFNFYANNPADLVTALLEVCGFHLSNLLISIHLLRFSRGVGIHRGTHR